MKKMLMLNAAVLISLAVFADVSVTSVTAKQLSPWNRLVDVQVGLSCASDELNEIGCTFAATNGATRVALPVTQIRHVGRDTGSGTSWTRHFIWDAAADLGEVKIDDVELTVEAKVLGGVQLWENGPYWAECNVGASKPEECGYYFWWGDTVGYKRNAADTGWVSVKDGTAFSFSPSSCPTYNKSTSELRSAGYIDSTGNLVAAHDAATVHLGAPWRMPTEAEFAVLISNCTTTWMTRNGVSGRLVVGKGAYVSKSIFLPVAGYGYGSGLNYLGSYGFYWSSTPDSVNSYSAWYLYFYSSYFGRNDYNRYCYGQSVRPVRGFAHVGGVSQIGGASTDAVATHLAVDCSNCGQGLRQADLDSTLTIEYSPDFADVGGNKAVRVLLNGEVWVESVVSGSKTFTFEEAGLYQFTHQVLVNGAVADSMTVTYAVAPQGHIAIPDTWTEIPNDFFENCDWLSSVEIPPSVSNIAATAFTGCVNITNVVLHGSATVSRLEPKLLDGTEWIEVDESLNGDKVFKSNDVDYRQSTAIQFDIPKGFGDFVFSWKVHPESNEGFKWYLDGVSKWLILGRSWNVVSNALDVGAAHRVKFVYSNDGYTNYEPGSCVYVSIRGLSKRPDVLKKIFPDSPVLSVTIGDEVDELSDGFFADCTTLESVSLPNILTTIGGDMFMGCSSLVAIAIHSGVTNICENAFLGCENLKRVDVASLDDWLKIGFANAEANPLSSGAKLCIGGANVTNILIPNGTTRIEACAFTGGDFTSVTIPSSVMNIGEDAFMRCENLKRVDVATLEDWQKIQFVNEGANPLGCGAELYVGGKRCVCRIDFDMNCDVSGPASMERSPRAFYGTLPTPERDGGLFLGWYTAPEGGERVSKEWVVDGDRTLYAHWVVVSDVKVFSGYPWQEVVIGYTITGKADQPMALDITAKDNETGKAYDCKTLEGVDFTPGRHVVKWNASADGAQFKSDEVVFTVRAATASYCVIDLSGGTSATSYSVTWLVDVPNGGWTDEHKTRKLALRRIEAGTFMMGSASGSDNVPHQVTLTKPFYIGVFEVTQRQWELVMGTKPAYFSNAEYYATRPVEKVSYEMIRGSMAGVGWPANNAVDATSFLGKLRAKTELDFDLPTEAQWEYACRAGKPSAYNNGGSTEDDLKQLGRYGGNGGSNFSSSCSPSAGTAKVGSYQPNTWGLYDMHGNVWEWCLDWWDGSLGEAMDPKGADSGSGRVVRGGGWAFAAGNCTASYRYSDSPSCKSSNYGFRLFGPLQKGGAQVVESGDVALAVASSAVVSVDTTFADGTDIKLWDALPVAFAPFGLTGVCSIVCDGEELLRTNECGVHMWNPGEVGSYVLTVSSGNCSMSSRVEFSTRLDAGEVRNGESVIVNGATSISDGAFANRDDLIAVTIPTSVTNIAETAFSGCKNITSVSVPPSVNVASVFADSKTQIARVMITGTGTVPASAYSGCAALSRVDVASLADWMSLSFANAAANPLSTGAKLYVGGTEVAALIVPDGTTEIGAYAFAGGAFSSVTIPNSVTNVAAMAFSGCVNITSVSVPASLNVASVFADSKTQIARVTITGTGTVPASAYSGCAALSRVDVASLADWLALSFVNAEANPLSIGAKLFVDGTEVSKLIIPDGATEVCAYAFVGGAFSSVTIPSSVSNIATTAFSGCANITAVVVPASLNVANVFADSKTKIARVTITGTGTVPASAYSGCAALSRVDVASLADWMSLSFANAEANPLSTGAKLFVDGTEVTEFIVPEGTTEICAYAFVGGAFSSVSIPSSVSNIATTAFSGCANITAVVVPASLNVANVFADSKTKITHVTIMGTGTVPASAYFGCVALARVEVASLADWMSLSFANAEANPLSTGAKLFVDGTEVSKLIIPDGATEVCAYAFVGGAFSSVTIPSSVSNIATTAFSGCANITAVVVPASLNVANVFADSKTKIAHVTIMGTGTVPASAYSGCAALSRVDVASLADWLSLSFANAEANPLSTGAKLYVDGTEVTGLIIPEGTTEIGAYAFAGGAFSSVSIPNSVTNVEATAFAGCKNITSVAVPASMSVATVFGDSKTNIARVTITGTGTVPTSAYSGCTALSCVEVASLEDWLALSFANAAANPLSTGAKLIVGGSEVTDLVIPSGTTSIRNYAFAGAAFTSVTIPTSVMSVGTGAFSGCKNIESVYVPSWMKVSELFASSLGVLREAVLVNVGGQIVESAFAGCSALREITIPEGTTKIAAEAFKGCASLVRVSLPMSLKTIGADAFAGCGAITAVTCPALGRLAEIFPASFSKIADVTIAPGIDRLPDGLFAGCAALRNLELPDGITVVGPGAFAGCSGLRNLVLPDSVSRFEIGAFDDCPALESITPPASLVDFRLADIPPAVRKSWGLEYDADGFIVWNGILVDYADKGASDIVIPEEVVVIGGEALAGMADLESVVWPSALKRIGMGAFASDTYLDNLAIPDTVETICEDAFADCSYLQTLTMGRGVKTVLDRAFKGCTQLAAVRFHPGLVSIGSEAFGGCWRMKSVGLPLSVAAVAEDAFIGCDKLEGLTMPTHRAPLSSWFKPVYRQIAAVTVPVGETDVIADMFDGCSALVELELPEGVTNIGSRACRHCLKLVSLTVPSTVVEIGEEAFRGCEMLEAIVLQSGVERIGAAAFSDCLRLKDVTLSESLTVLPEHLFAGCRALDSLTVPKSVNFLGADFVSSWTTELYYLGNAPAFDENAYRGADMALTSYVINGTKGWDGRPTSRDLPESWPVGNGYARSIKTWTTVRYDVTFDAGSGIFAPVSSNAYACEESVGSVYAIPPYEPRLVGMKFDGWWTEPEAGSRITANTLVVLQKAHTLYAHWKSVPTIRVRFNACGGTVMPGEDSYAVGEPFGYFPEPTREHYAFAGWYDRAEGGREVLVSHEVPGANVELFAHWTPCLYILRLHANNGTAAVCDQLFTYGETVTILDYETLRSRNGFDAPQGCAFAGWAVNPGGEAIYADEKTLDEVGDIEDGVIHLWACWSRGRYSVRFDSHGGTGRMDDQTFQIGVPQALIKNRYVRDGFLFGGWALTTDSDAAYADGDVVKDLTTVKDATVSLYAVWVRQSGTSIVTFELNGGTLEPSHAERTSGAAFGTLPVPTRTGYTFARWTLRDGTTVTASSIVPQTDVTLYAVWSPNGYDIVFDANGGTGTMDALNCVYDQECELPASGFAREGHVFMGWSTDADGEVEYEDGATVVNLTGSDDGEVRLYAVWEPEKPVAPVITPASGTVFLSDGCTVSISCATEGATIYCSTTAVPRPTAGNVYSAPFVITETTTVYAFAVRGGRQSATVSATITKRVMSLAESVGAPELTVATGGAAAWCPVADESVDEDGVSARSGRMEAAAAAGGNESWMEVSVKGAGTLAFWWRVDCEDDGPGTVTWDRLMYLVDGVEQERIDGWTDWERRTVEFSTPGEHKVRWTYHKDDYDDPLFPGEDCGWIDRVSWTPSATPEPSIAGDAGATVTGDAENGFVVTPSIGKTEIEVTIPEGVDAAKVTVAVATDVMSVKPNGARVKIMKGADDIAPHLDVPVRGDGVLVISEATVKEAVVKEALDPKKGAVIKMAPENPTVTTAATRPGLVYRLREGTTIDGMKFGDSKTGDGSPWSPLITVKGGASAFYTIDVGK